MSFLHFIRIIRGNQEQERRFARIVECFVMFYLLIAGLWSLCHVVSRIFIFMGVS